MSVIWQWMPRGVAIAAATLFLSSQAMGAGILRYATIGEPPSLDVQMGTATIAATIGNHMFETLYAFDSRYKPQPLLATGEKIEDGGKRLVIGLRQGVKFHNGQEMTADDVVASLKRWGEFGARGQLLMKNATSVQATGKYEVTLNLSEPNGAWKNMLAYPEGGPVIYPAGIVGAAGNKPIEPKDYVGTGPYKFGEWRPNRYVELLRFEGYSKLPTPADGYAGTRAANFDAIRFIPVPDVGTRISGVQAGDYDYAEFISGDLYDSLKANPAIRMSSQRRAAVRFVLHELGERNFEGQLRAAPRHPDRAEEGRGAAGLVWSQGPLERRRLDLSKGQPVVHYGRHPGLQRRRPRESEADGEGCRLYRHANSAPRLDQLPGAF